jgi:euchromatic histone-lysine N-methyltransferase
VAHTYQLQELSNSNNTNINSAYSSTYSGMLSAGKCLYREVSIISDIPAMLIGNTFVYRNKLLTVGLHTEL